MTATASDQGALDIARRNMVEYQIRCCKVLEPELLDMLDSMPREDYVPQDVRSLAYMEGHVPIACNQEMFSPLQEASIMQQLNLQGHERILEIGTGTGYLTTLLAMHSAEVTSCELHAELSEFARKNLSDHGVENATVIRINAMDPDEVKKHAYIATDYDVIVIGASLSAIPEHLTALLAENAQMIAFIGKNPIVTLTHKQKTATSNIETAMCETLLQNMEELPQKREFIF
ncbi:MAG: protein-L-isoaspartate(D-aspartate) O-methyltransferase [Proteobacteria bacterium]|nr:MAG: protein-L-isoaspartate(D-aspartate) O-methyltransferase [Pseudomonadota bacterium]